MKSHSIQTFVGIDIVPDIQALVHDAPVSASEGSLDEERDLLRVTVGNAGLSDLVGRVAPDRRGTDDVGLDVSCKTFSSNFIASRATADLPCLSALMMISSTSLCNASSGRVSI